MLYYLAGVSVVGTIDLVYFIYMMKPQQQQLWKDFSWTAVRAYHRVNMETNNLRRYLENEIIETKNSDNEYDNDESEEEEEN